ncbi:MAG: hypothetical protein KKF98_15140, partial [Bacteroidetes bacterium]|nr:hypothetical protein [Bacteroidota bacterium]
MKKFMLITLLVAWGILSFAQGIYNDGAHIVSTSDSYWVVDNGSFTLTSTSASNLAQMDNLVIMGDASLVLDASAASSHLTVSGDLTVNSGGSLTVESTANGTGSLIVGGTPSGNVTVERYLTADKWHYISGQTNISGNFSTLSMGLSGGAGNDQFYRWEENYNYGGNIGNWVDILNGEDGTGTNSLMDDEGFEDCKGYAITYKLTSETLSLSGVPYVANQNITITKTTGSNHEGSNLVGNPFCSTIAINDDADASNN